MSVEERVIEIVSEQMGVSKDQVTRETSFVNDLGADSLDTVELVMEFEEEFDITIPDEEAEKIQTVGQAIDYIEQARPHQVTPPTGPGRGVRRRGRHRDASPGSVAPRASAALIHIRLVSSTLRSKSTWDIHAASSSPVWGWSRRWAKAWIGSGRRCARARAESVR